MSDMDPGLDDLHLDPPPATREGLPPKYRMRADAHYVEELDSSLFSAPIRQLDVRSIDPIPGDRGPSADFVESVRRHGVLQPLLVRSRAGRFQIMAGGKRLAAALEAGLKEVPCLVERVDDEQAKLLAAATNVPSTPRQPALQPERPRSDAPLRALADAVTAVASSAALLSSGSALTQAVALDLVRAEAARALQLLRALQVSRDEVKPRRATVFAGTLIQRVVESTEAERRLRGPSLTVIRGNADPLKLLADEELLVASIGALVVAAPALFESNAAPSVTLAASLRPDNSVAFVAEHGGAELPIFWRSVLADDDGADVTTPGGTATRSALALLRAARHVAELHGGRMSVDCLDGSTTLSMAIPVAR